MSERVINLTVCDNLGDLLRLLLLLPWNLQIRNLFDQLFDIVHSVVHSFLLCGRHDLLHALLQLLLQVLRVETLRRYLYLRNLNRLVYNLP